MTLTPAVMAFLALTPVVQAQEDSDSSSPSGNPGRGFGGLGQGFNRGSGRGYGGRFIRGSKFRQGQNGENRNFAFMPPPNIERGWSGKGKPQLQELVVDGVKRRYYIYKPDSAAVPAPLVLAFHGGGGNAEGTDKCAGGIAKLADEKGFIVVYPDAIDKHWNDGRPDLSKTNYDDVGFISKLIDDLNAKRLIDTKRVYATGISNGGFFSQYLAIKLPEKIAAVATVAASVSTSFLDLKITPVPIMMLLGTEDTLVPWNGGKVGGKVLRKGRGEVIPGRQALEFWLAHNKNNARPNCTELPDKDPTDNSRVIVEQYGASDSSNEVVLYEIRGGGHTWPDGQQYLPKSIIGPVCRDFDGNLAIWNFFEKHAL
jgi:polyhydroxybutyrate depolymerase